ncbi:MAG: aminoacyl-tRNA deacylase [Desulfobacteraceae bacterium]|jgi:Cys-tRNA(Pro)/Cys-tRNA(Cys) deacylase
MTTRGIQFLKQNRITHQTVKYDHKEKGAEYAARAVGFPLGQTIKTLVVALDSHRYALVMMPGDRQVSMKKVAKACNAKRAAMADTTTAQRLTGYLVGGISPFGTKNPLKAVMDASLPPNEAVMINAGQRGIMVKIAPGDIIDILKADIADLAQ